MPHGFTASKTASIDYISLYVYVVEGVILMVLNGSFAVLIYSSKNLRSQKEYIIFAGSMVYDFLFGLMYFLAGIRRLGIFYGPEKYVESYSRWECYTVFHAFLFVLNTPTSGVMSFLSCLDRFVSVTYPTKYLRLTPNYGYSLTIITFLCVIPTTVASGVLSYLDRNVFEVSAMCVLQMAIPEFMFYVLRGIRIIATIVGVLMYVCIGYKIYYLIRPIKTDTQTLSHVKRKRLVTMTTTFLLITLNQLLLFVAPDIYLLLNPTTSSLVFYVMNMNKGVVNIIILLITQRELRRTLTQRLHLAAASNVAFLTETTRMFHPVSRATRPSLKATTTVTMLR